MNIILLLLLLVMIIVVGIMTNSQIKLVENHDRHHGDHGHDHDQAALSSATACRPWR